MFKLLRRTQILKSGLAVYKSSNLWKNVYDIILYVQPKSSGIQSQELFNIYDVPFYCIKSLNNKSIIFKTNEQ